MKEHIFHRYVAIAVALLFILSLGAKAYSATHEIYESDWNYRQIEEIDRRAENLTGNNFTFIAFGDNKNSEGIFNDLIERVNEEDPLFSINTGDIVFRGAPPYYEMYIEQARNFKDPSLTVLGNHELYSGGRGYYYEAFGPYYYSFTVKDSYFIVLDNANGDVDDWQMAWLKEELKLSQNYTHRFIFMHMPLYDPRENGPGHSMENMETARELNELFDESNVTMVFCGHIHGYFKGTWEKTPYIITGGAGGEIIGGLDEEHYFYNYVRVHVNETGVSTEVVRLDSPNYAERALYSLWFHIYVFVEANALNIVIFITGAYTFYYVVFLKKEWLSHNFGRKKEDKKI